MIAPVKTIQILDGYEGLGGFRNGKYYPYQVDGDVPGVLTIGRGHKITEADLEFGKFKNGLKLDQVNELFSQDISDRELDLEECLEKYTSDQFAGALSMFYNEESAWYVGTPGIKHRAGNFQEAAAGILLYINADGKPLLGLWRRRMTEALCYLTGEVIVAKDATTQDQLINELKTHIPVVCPAGLL